MVTLQKTADLLPLLKTFEGFSDVPGTALQWLIDKSDYVRYDEGTIFKPGDPIDHMLVIIKGRYVVKSGDTGTMRELGVYHAGFVTGVLPFSRMTQAGAFGVILEPCSVLQLHRDYFVEMTNVCYDLTRNLVAMMSNRIREFSQMRFYNEKLMALGKMSAGLAHELNNPASAMVRSAEDLYKKLHQTPEKFKSVIMMDITPEQTDEINAILFEKIRKADELNLTMLEREERYDDLLDWLHEYGIEGSEDIAETFVDFGWVPGELDRIAAILQKEDIATILWWLESTMDLERLVNEIRESATRVSSLVKSVKNYSHMDRGSGREPADIHDGLRNTLMMLKFKLKQKNVQLDKQFDSTLPKFPAVVSDLNQVWTNLLVNAIDAIADGGKIEVRTSRDREYICVDITDNGSGIPEALQTRIFEPFFTTKKPGEGTGMGLDITKRIIDRHGGTIAVDSEPGRTTFRVCFPLEEAIVPLEQQ